MEIMIGQQFQQLWTSDDNIHPLQDEPYKSTFFFFNTPDHEELNAEDASTGSVYSVTLIRTVLELRIRVVGFTGTITFCNFIAFVAST